MKKKKDIFYLVLSTLMLITLILSISFKITRNAEFPMIEIAYYVISFSLAITFLSLQINRFGLYKILWWGYIFLLPVMIYYVISSKKYLSSVAYSASYIYLFYIFCKNMIIINFSPLINILYLFIPNNTDIILKKADLLYRKEKYRKSLVLVDIAKKNNLSFEKYGLIEGYSYYFLNDYNQSKEILCSWLDKYNHKNAYTYSIIGYSLFHLNDPKEAIKFLLKSLKLYPKEKDTIFYLASSYANLENYDKAISYSKEYLTLDPNNSYLLYNLGLHYQAIDENDEAIKVWEQSINQVSPCPSSFIAIAYEYYIKNDIKNAILYYRKGINLKPENIEYIPEDIKEKVQTIESLNIK
jgi:tetratricopeptide (TPR) repeat protein